jgi:hypothetical protein
MRKVKGIKQSHLRLRERLGEHGVPCEIKRFEKGDGSSYALSTWLHTQPGLTSKNCSKNLSKSNMSGSLTRRQTR